MGRIHLFEFEDLPWFPPTIRRYMTDYLQFIGERFHLFDPLAPRIAEIMRKAGTDQLVDLCSGSGGTMTTLLPAITAAYGAPVHATLTDLYPHVDAFERVQAQLGRERVAFRAEPVNATEVPADLEGMRLISLAFHHLPPALARSVLQDAVRQRRPIGVFEVTERTPLGVIGPLTAPLTLAVMTPFMRPFTFGRLFWTYVIPAVPIFTAWDGIVSVLRTYSPRELRALVDSLDDHESFHWDIGYEPIPRSPSRATFLLGWPREVAA